MSDWAIVTGGGTGLGRAVVHALAREGVTVMAVGRRQGKLDESRAFDPERIHALSADVSTAEGREAVRSALPGEARLRYLVHNAGVLQPVGPLADVVLQDWRHAMAVNVEAPLFLTQTLLERLAGGRVLHISSGAAHHGYAGWGAYCSSKAALFMIYQILREELRGRHVRVGSLRPGVVDTPMQELIREQSEERFPAVKRFLELKESGQLQSPSEVADFIRWVLMESAERQFDAEEWDIGNERHRQLWKPEPA